MKTLILYFSPTGQTEKAAREIHEATGGVMEEIVPRHPYTDADLDWENPESRTTREKNDPKIRPEFLPLAIKPDDYDMIFLGFPIWWGQEPNIIRSVLDKYKKELIEKQIYPFATSDETDIEMADIDFYNRYPDLNWHHGLRFPATKEKIREWIAR